MDIIFMGHGGLLLLEKIFNACALCFNIRGRNYSRMAPEPRIPRKFSPTEVNSHTVYVVFTCWTHLAMLVCLIWLLFD